MPYPKIKCGCLGCGKRFKAYKDGRKALELAVQHMNTCCPEKMHENTGLPLLQRCWIGCKNCEVPGYVHEDKEHQKARKRAEAEDAAKSIDRLFALREQLRLKCELVSQDDVLSGWHDYWYESDEYDEFDQTEVDFFRPDGDCEGKDVQWCLDNDFFQVEEGLWSGIWYYKFYPDEKRYHEDRLRQTEVIRHNNKTKYPEYQRQTESLTTTAASVGTKPSFSTNLNPNAATFTPGQFSFGGNAGAMHASGSNKNLSFADSSTVQPFCDRGDDGEITRESSAFDGISSATAETRKEKTYSCKACSREFLDFGVALRHMRKCCPEQLSTDVTAKRFTVDTCTYECFLCYKEFPIEDECLRHIERCPSFLRLGAGQIGADTFVHPKPRRRFVCETCGSEHAKWFKCLAHMENCCPEIFWKGEA